MKSETILFLLLALLNNFCYTFEAELPVVINTWRFTEATKEAWKTLTSDGSTALDAVEAGCMTCERLQCDGTVGFGGSPDENGETTLDAMIMNGADLNVGAVAGLRRIKDVISVARHVLENTEHTLIVGDQATEFAKRMGFKEESLSTPVSLEIWKLWIHKQCQPNFWKNVAPNPKRECGPYKPVHPNSLQFWMNWMNKDEYKYSEKNHDTIGMIAIDEHNNIVAGTSTNGARHKIPGRVGDSPIPGAGAYADNDVGAAVATGDGDIMMRFLPSYLAVEEMRRGNSPQQAATIAMNRIISKHPKFFGGLVAINKVGEYGASCRGMKEFPFSLANKLYPNVTVITVPCL